MIITRYVRGYGIVIFFMLSLIATIAAQGQAEIHLDDINAYAAAEVTIERLRKQNPVDWNAIHAQYAKTLPIVQHIDAVMDLNYEQDIEEALKKCIAGENARVNQQILAKGLQHITVLAITDELNALGKSTSAGKKIAAYFEGIRPTFARRGSDFFGDAKMLETTADLALERLAKAHAADLLTVRRELDDVIARTYALSVLYEIMEIEKLRDSDLDTCAVKLKEAEIFYRIIQPSMKKHGSKSDAIISNMLNGSYQMMDAALLEHELQTGLRGMKLR